MSSGMAVKSFLSKIPTPGESSNESVNNTEIEFHGKIPIEENSLNGLCINNVYVPEEIIENIFVLLNPKEILNCSLVCKRWCNIAKSNSLWHTIYNIREHPKKAKNWPWYVFYNYFTTDNFKNLLKNGNGQEDFNHWTIISSRDSIFVIEDPPQESDLLPDGIPEFNGYTSCFAIPFYNCSKYQEINLSPKKLLRYIIKKHKPYLYLSEWCCAEFDCDSSYTLAVKCDTKDNICLPMESKNRLHDSPDPESFECTTPYYLKSLNEIEQWAEKEWKKVELTTNNYLSDDLEIYFYHGGDDGCKMAGGVIKFLFDSMEPTVEDISDMEY